MRYRDMDAKEKQKIFWSLVASALLGFGVYFGGCEWPASQRDSLPRSAKPAETNVASQAQARPELELEHEFRIYEETTGRKNCLDRLGSYMNRADEILDAKRGAYRCTDDWCEVPDDRWSAVSRDSESIMSAARHMPRRGVLTVSATVEGAVFQTVIKHMEGRWTFQANRFEKIDTKSSSSGSSSLLEAPSRDDVKTALQGVSGAVKACKKDSGGTATVNVTFSGKTGRASGAKVASGPFKGTSVGSCIESAVKRARVPRFKRSSFKVTFPYRL